MARNPQRPLSQPVGGWLIFIFLIWLFLASVTLADDQPVGEIALIDGRAIHYVETGNPDGNVAVIIEAGALEQEWRDSHARLVKNQPNAALQIAEKSRHTWLYDEPEAVIAAIKEIADATLR